MSMRILGGEWRGRRLRVPRGGRARPSSGRLREALFSVLGDDLIGSRVVDLFAGSGALGLEALSRGAAHTTFVELDPGAIRAIHQNLDDLGADSDRALVRRMDARRWLAKARAGAETVDVVLADPPYVPDLPAQFLPAGAALVESGRARWFVLEHPRDVEPAPALPSRLRCQTRTVGESAFTWIQEGPA